jgi:hypothetical protein
MSREELNALIKCPIDWISETGEEEGVVSILQYDWYHCLNEHAVSADEHVTDLDGFDHEEFDPEQLRRLIANLELRKCEKIDCHKKRAGRLAGLRFRRPSEDGKHFIAGGDRLYLQSHSRGRISYFYTDYRSADLRAAFWSWFFRFFFPVASLDVYEEMLTPGTEDNVSYYGQLWYRFLDPQLPAGPLRVCFDCLGPVGGSSGKETSHICYDIDLSTRTAHAYPVSKSEAEQIMGDGPVCGIDDLNC